MSRKFFSRLPTQRQLIAARNTLAALVELADLSAVDVQRAQDGIRVLEDAFYRTKAPA